MKLLTLGVATLLAGGSIGGIRMDVQPVIERVHALECELVLEQMRQQMAIPAIFQSSRAGMHSDVVLAFEPCLGRGSKAVHEGFEAQVQFRESPPR